MRLDDAGDPSTMRAFPFAENNASDDNGHGSDNSARDEDSMTTAPDDRLAPRRFGFVLVPGFSMLAVSSAVDVLRAARLDAPGAGFGWALLSPSDADGPVAASSGIRLDAAPRGDPAGFDAVAICGGERTHDFRDADLERWLRRAARSGAAIGSLSDGAFLVASTGLFDRCRSTIHWKCQSAYRERFPGLDIRASLLEIDRARFSCAGGTASLDLMLHFVLRVLGPGAAGRIADNYVHDRLRGDDHMQHEAGGYRMAGRDPVLAAALSLMEANMEQPLPIAQIAARVDVSARQLDRSFHRYLNVAPSAHYRGMRLVRAAGLLRQSGLAIGEIALCCGFQSASHLGRHFRIRYGTTPSVFRRSR